MLPLLHGLSEEPACPKVKLKIDVHGSYLWPSKIVRSSSYTDDFLAGAVSKDEVKNMSPSHVKMKLQIQNSMENFLAYHRLIVMLLSSGQTEDSTATDDFKCFKESMIGRLNPAFDSRAGVIHIGGSLRQMEMQCCQKLALIMPDYCHFRPWFSHLH